MCCGLVGSEMVVLYVPKDVGDARHCAVDDRSQHLWIVEVSALIFFFNGMGLRLGNGISPCFFAF